MAALTDPLDRCEVTTVGSAIVAAPTEVGGRRTLDSSSARRRLEGASSRDRRHRLHSWGGSGPRSIGPALSLRRGWIAELRTAPRCPSLAVDWVAPGVDPTSSGRKGLERLVRRQEELLAPRLLFEEVANDLLAGVWKRRWSEAEAAPRSTAC